tara:strand:+ start:359 stop:532 length:174 start_codon:yes stop_codon:yes gene_type:complete
MTQAAANFAQLCSGERGTNARGIKLHFVGTQLQRVIPGFMAQVLVSRASHSQYSQLK